MEPEGIVEIKFKLKDQVLAMARLDPVLLSLQDRLKEPDLPEDEQTSLKQQLQKRQEHLRLPYHQVCVW